MQRFLFCGAVSSVASFMLTSGFDCAAFSCTIDCNSYALTLFVAFVGGFVRSSELRVERVP